MKKDMNDPLKPLSLRKNKTLSPELKDSSQKLDRFGFNLKPRWLGPLVASADLKLDHHLHFQPE